jgi:hypothetical protein
LLFSNRVERGADARLIDGIFSPAIVTFPAELPMGRRRAGTLLAAARHSFCAFLSFAGEA